MTIHDCPWPSSSQKSPSVPLPGVKWDCNYTRKAPQQSSWARTILPSGLIQGPSAGCISQPEHSTHGWYNKSPIRQKSNSLSGETLSGETLWDKPSIMQKLKFQLSKNCIKGFLMFTATFLMEPVTLRLHFFAIKTFPHKPSVQKNSSEAISQFRSTNLYIFRTSCSDNVFQTLKSKD